MKRIKKIFAIVALILIFGWIIATFVIAVTNFPGKQELFRVFMLGCIAFPVIAWVGLWMLGILTNKKNIASFRSEEMEDNIKKAELIKEKLKRQEETK